MMTLAKRRKDIIRGSAALAALPFFLCLLAACAPEKPIEAFYAGETMGTVYHVKVVARESALEKQALDELIQQTLDKVDGAMSTYKEASELSRFNQYQEATPFPFSPEMRAVFSCAFQVSDQSAGAFDITVGPLVNAWGFGPDEKPLSPDTQQLSALRERVGWRQLVLRDAGMVKARPDIYCDLSALAKGYAVDQVAQVLEALGFTRYLVEVGGETRCLGKNIKEKIWTIGIEKPVEQARAVQRVLALSGQSLATSGDYRNFKLVQGRRLSHAIDPRTGEPVSHPPASVSVVHPSCMWADAYATALMVLGVEEGLRCAEEHGLAVLFILRGDGEDFEERMSSAFAGLL